MHPPDGNSISAMPSRRAAATRLMLAGGVLAALALPAALAGPAAASTEQAGTGLAGQDAAITAREHSGAQHSGSQHGGSPVSVVITSVSPAYARPGQKVTVQGLVTNASPAAVTGLRVQLGSSSAWFMNRDQLQQFAGGSDPGAASPEQGAVAVIPGTLPPRATVRWTAVLPVNEVHMTVFGVYPLAAQATSAAGTLGASYTFLPFWPTGKGKVRPREDISWIWPLIDVPDQGPCAGLLNNSLAGSLSSGGRLAGLLSAGSSAAGQAAHLTWVLDPALLSSAKVMTAQNAAHTYTVGANASCHQAATRPASAAAAAWLARLRSTVSGQPAFVTPYADVDIAALTQDNLYGDVDRAFTVGRSVAGRILGRSFMPTTPASGPQSAAGLTSAAAWPASGLANYAMLENLAAVDGIRTVVLSTAAMPPATPQPATPSGVSATADGEGGNMHVLLADATLTALISSLPPGSGPGATFATRQRFLAETAMIAAEEPNLPRAIVVAPPRRWNPAAGLAAGLLTDTTTAPWLSPVSAGSLAAQARVPGQVQRSDPAAIGPRLLSQSLLRGVQAAERGVQLLQSIRPSSAPQLDRAIAGIESSAWRAGPAQQRRARSLLSRVNEYVARQGSGVSLIGPGRVTLGGQTGLVPVPIDNKLHYPVRVRVQVNVSHAADGFTVIDKPAVVQIPADTIVTEKVKVRAADVGSTTIGLSLVAPDGQALTSRPITMTVTATHFGTLGLTVLALALGVFVVTSAMRAIRRGRTPPGGGPVGAPGQDAPAGTGTAGHEQPEETDNVGHDRAESGEAGTDHVLTEDADDYARVPGWADRR
jgi:hypothetical protein